MQTLSSQFTSVNENFKLPADWTAPFETFTKGVQEVSMQTNKNVSATAAAAQSAIAKTVSKLTKVSSTLDK